MSETVYRNSRNEAQQEIWIEARVKQLDEEESYAWELYAEQVKDLKGQDYLDLEPWYGHELEAELRRIQKLRSGLLTLRLVTEYEFEEVPVISSDDSAPQITPEDIKLLLDTETGMAWNGYLKLTSTKQGESYQIMEPKAWRWLQRRLSEIEAERKELDTSQLPPLDKAA